jgi:hypothetical protein
MGSVGSDMRLQNAMDQLQIAATPEGIKRQLATIREAAYHRVGGIVGPNPFLKYKAADLNDPRYKGNESRPMFNITPVAPGGAAARPAAAPTAGGPPPMQPGTDGLFHVSAKTKTGAMKDYSFPNEQAAQTFKKQMNIQ